MIEITLTNSQRSGADAETSIPFVVKGIMGSMHNINKFKNIGLEVVGIP